MAFVFYTVKLFDAETFSQCLVVPFPENGKIVDLQVHQNAAYLVVESVPDAKPVEAHFHVVPLNTPIYSDSHRYVGMLKFDNFAGLNNVSFLIIEIPSGDFGIHSKEFIESFGAEKRDEIMNDLLNPNRESSKDIPAPDQNDEELKKLWDFDFGKNDDLVA